jgi:secondary thiamine-phosphate synthase enzyme
MSTHQATFRLKTQGRGQIIDISEQVARIVAQSRVQNGIVNVSGKGSTLGVTTLEYEPGCIADLQRALEKIAPSSADYAHNARWGDGNGYAHLRSALLGTAKSFPVIDGRPAVGTWQQIVLCDFDNRPRDREVLVTVVGD